MRNIKDILEDLYFKSTDELSQSVNEVTLDDNVKKDEPKESKYFFKNVLMFTNERDESKNKTLKNVKDAIEGTDIKLHVFVAEEVEFDHLDEGGIHIEDSKSKFNLDKQSNIDTIVITRLSAQDYNVCIECIKELQDWGLFVINPIEEAQVASNKYSTAMLLKKYDIPQPKFTLLNKNDIEDGEESLEEKLKAIYPDVGQDKEVDKKKEYVLKILDGHGGTGVAMVTGKEILPIIQMCFAVDEELELLLQKKEEADGGDIRVHVLTLRNKQLILASMKRVKISDDFRSNVSLGATAEKIVLTAEQEKLALKVGKISGMPWCAVDIMPLKKGSNLELGDNVILEYNASPGTEGISEVIGKNFMTILFDAINDISELVLAPKSVGYIEKIKMTLDNDKTVELDAKLDTGNGALASTLGCEKIEVQDDNITAIINGTKYTFKRHGQSTPKVGQVEEIRETVLIPYIQIGSRRYKDAEFALVDNRHKSTPVLLNRDLLSKMGYVIDAGKKHTLE